MAIHTDLPIYRTGVQLLDLAVRVQEQMPRGLKRIMGEPVGAAPVRFEPLIAPARGAPKAAFEKHVMDCIRDIIDFTQTSAYDQDAAI